jgi:AraC-like DNA-binding protein
MDRGALGWYFSTMARRPQRSAVRLVRFHRTKYGRELLVDAAFLRDLPNFDFSDRPYALDFHDILLVTRGRGSFELDARVYRVAPGVVLFTRPGEVRRFRVAGLDGACLFFSADFLAEAFADPRFLQRFACFRRDRPSAALRLGRAERRDFLALFKRMTAEIASLPADVSHALRAQLYEMLVALDRFYVARHGAPPRAEPEGTVERFRALLEAQFARRQRVADYARQLGLTPGHLSLLCRRQLGQGAGACVRQRLRQEAQRLLLFTDLSATEVGYRLGFEDPAYFARFFKREAGVAPGRYRAARRAEEARYHRAR